MKKTLLTLVFSAAAMFTTAASESFSGHELASEGAWCWFADPRAMHNPDANASYAGYIDVHGNIKATQYNFTDNTRSEVLVRSYFQPDDHNNPTFLVLPDGRVLIIYSRHTDERAFYYRVSKRPGDISDLGDEKKISTSANTTYPSPFILSDDPEHFYLCWRGIGWHPTIARFTLPDANDEVKADWGPYQMVQSTGSRPYAKYYSNGKDKLYVTYTTGHPDNEQPNWVYFNAININATKAADGKVSINPALEDIKGNKLKNISDGTFAVNKKDDYKKSYPYTVVDAPSNMRDWVWQIATAPDGNPVIAMVRINGGKSQHDYHYAKWTGSEWRITFLANGGGRFHSSNTEYCYSGGMAIDPQNVDDIYLSIPTEGDNGTVYEIWKYTVDADGKVAATEQITKNSVKNNVRPYVLPGSKGSKLRVAWMNGDYYYWMVNKNYPAGYPTDIRSDYKYTVTVDAAKAKASATTAINKAVSAADSYSIALPSGNFTLNLPLGISHDNYSGTIISAAGFKYGLGADAIPYVEINGKRYNSSNRLYTSDNWAYNSNGTNSDNWPTKIDSFDLSISYDGKVLTTYRNGLIDQKIECTGLNTANAAIGGFDGNAGTASIYNSCLNQDELRYARSAAVLDAISVPAAAVTDLVLADKIGGQSIEWTSSHPEIINARGIFIAPAAETTVTLTASLGGNTRTFAVKALPRDITLNLLASYDFAKADADNKVADISGNGRDLTVMGNATVDGTLNLTANKASAFDNNGYALLPEGILNGLRSYTVCFDATAKSITSAPRFYDFGVNSGNSLFCRVNSLAAGIKQGGGTTMMVDAKNVIKTNMAYKVAVVYSAATGTTTIYLDGRVAVEGKNVTAEAYRLLEAGADVRNYIGRTQWWEGEYGKDNVDFVGTIDNFNIYNTALTAEELAQVQGFEAENPSLDIDCTKLITNADFEGGFKVQPGTGVDSDRALYLPDGWAMVYSKGNRYDLSVLDGSCLYANLFAELPLPENAGAKTYRVRQKWGASNFGLCQILKTVPAGYYRMTADTFCKGAGTVNVYASNTNGQEAYSVPDNSTWGKASVLFTSNGNENITLGFSTTHATDTEVISGFDNFTLTDVTANRTAGELNSLLGRMVSVAKTMLAGEFSNPAVRLALQNATDAAEARSASDSQASLFALYTALRDAIAAAIDDKSGIDAIEVETPAADGPVFDLTGRRVADSLNGTTLAPGIYICNGRKIMMR